MVERRQYMHVDMEGVLAPTGRRGRPQLLLQGTFAQIEPDNRRAVFERGADKGVPVQLRDNRRTLHLHGHSHSTPCATPALPLDT